MKKKRYNLFNKNSIKIFLKKLWDILNKPEMVVLPGQLAFFLILSLVPIITLIGYGASLFGISADFIVEAINNNFSESVATLIIPSITGQALDGKMVIMLGVMFYIASNGASSIIVTSNEIYDIKQSSWLKRRFKALLLTTLLVLLYLFILIVPVFGNQIINALDYFDLKSTIALVLKIIQGPISWVIIYIFLKVIYMIAPDKNLPSKQTTPGAIFTAIMWVIATAIYGYYITHLARYDIFYASMSNIAILMLWIYFLSYFLVIGMSINSKLDKEELAKTGSIF